MSADIERAPEVQRALADSAGGYLRNTIRAARVTCATCTTPVPPDSPHERCYPCGQLHAVVGIADLIAPLIYGIEGEQSHYLVRHYKDDPDAAVRRRLSLVVNRLLFLGIVLHQRCIERRAGAPVDRRLTVPSLSGRPGVHPFVGMAARTRATGTTPVLMPSATASAARTVSGSHFDLVGSQTDLTGEHVLILDDTWTTGSRAQSAAMTLRRYGAKHVSVLVISRYMKPAYGDNAEFIRTRLRRDYDPRTCPVTGGECP